MMKFRFSKKINSMNMLFNGHYLDAKALYVFETGTIPCISFIGEIDVTKAFAYIKENFGADVKHTYQHSYFDHDSKQSFFNNTIFVMANERMIELGNNYCHVLHSKEDYGWAGNMLTALADFRMVAEAAGAATAKTQVVGFARQVQMN